MNLKFISNKKFLQNNLIKYYRELTVRGAFPHQND